jgi:hypothetical protein
MVFYLGRILACVWFSSVNQNDQLGVSAQNLEHSQGYYQTIFQIDGTFFWWKL